MCPGRADGRPILSAFAVAFWLGGVAWTSLGLATVSAEAEPYIYLIRLLSFLIIIAAIVDKNRKKPGAASLSNDLADNQSRRRGSAPE